MKLMCSTMCTGTVVSVVSYSDGMCQSRSTALKMITAGHGRVIAHHTVRSVLWRSRGDGRAPGDPEEDQWRRDHHQQHVLDHVDREQVVVAAAVDRRLQGDEGDQQPGEEEAPAASADGETTG